MGSVAATHVAATTPHIDFLIVDRGFDDIRTVIADTINSPIMSNIFDLVGDSNLSSQNAVNFLKAGL